MAETIKSPDGKLYCLKTPDGRKIHFNKVVINDDLTADLYIEDEIPPISATLPNECIAPELLAFTQSLS